MKAIRVRPSDASVAVILSRLVRTMPYGFAHPIAELAS